MNLASFFVASKIIVFVTFTTYVLLGNVITASRVFVAVSLYGAVRLTVTLFFPSAVEKVSESIVSIRRIKVWCDVVGSVVDGSSVRGDFQRLGVPVSQRGGTPSVPDELCAAPS